MSRRKWTADEKMNIVLEGLAPGATIAEICRKHKIAQTQFYAWREAFLSGGQAGLTTGGACTREKELEEQLRDAQAKIGEQALQIDILKKDELGPEVSTRDLVRRLYSLGHFCCSVSPSDATVPAS